MKQTQTVLMSEQLSALVDGQLQGEALAGTIDAVAADAGLRATWQTYHLVGDVLRTGAHSACGDQALFISRLRGRLAEEAVPARSAVTLAESAPVLPAPVAPRGELRAEAANERQFRWKLVAGFASVAAVAAIGWNLIGIPGAGPAPAQLAYQQPGTPSMAITQQGAPMIAIAQQPPAPLAPVQTVAAALPQPAARPVANFTPTKVVIGNGSPQVMLRDPRLDQLLEAHQQAGGVSLPAGFLRNATFERPSR